MTTENIKQTRLDNGLVVLTDKMHGVRSATLGFFFRTGARDEPADLHGITHFIEHAVFKGTSRRSALDIAIEQERLGGNLDAFTSHEETGFAIKVIDDQLPQAFDLIADMLVDPRFDEADLESEQRVIIEEMKMIDDSAEEYLGEIFSEAFFPDQPLGRSIAGTPASVKPFDHEKTRKYHAATFSPANLVIATAGNVDHEQIVELVNAALFSSQRTQKTQNKETSGISAVSADYGFNNPPESATPFIVKNRPDLEQAHLIIATPFTSATDERRYAADLLADIIGGGTASRLWQTIREEHGLAYNVGSSAAMYRDCGVFSIFAATSPEQVVETIDLAIAELRNIVNKGVTADELYLAKQQSRASILLSLEDSAARAAALAQSEITFGRVIPVEETLAKIDAVSLDDLTAITHDYFEIDGLAFAAIGDLAHIDISKERIKI